MEPERLRRLLEKYPGLAGMPIGLYAGRVISLGEALRLLEAGDTGVKKVLEEAGLDPPIDRVLAAEFYRRALSMLGPLRIYVLGVVGGPLTVSRAVEEILRGTPVGETLVEAYRRLRRLVAWLATSTS